MRRLRATSVHVKCHLFNCSSLLEYDRLCLLCPLHAQSTRNERAREVLSTQLQRVEQAMRQEQDRRRKEKIDTEWKVSEGWCICVCVCVCV